MPDRMPNRMSEDMSDRMPEDVPVRTCINVMVGITRSKVIFWVFHGRIPPINLSRLELGFWVTSNMSFSRSPAKKMEGMIQWSTTGKHPPQGNHPKRIQLIEFINIRDVPFKRWYHIIKTYNIQVIVNLIHIWNSHRFPKQPSAECWNYSNSQFNHHETTIFQ